MSQTVEPTVRPELVAEEIRKAAQTNRMLPNMPAKPVVDDTLPDGSLGQMAFARRATA